MDQSLSYSRSFTGKTKEVGSLLLTNMGKSEIMMKARVVREAIIGLRAEIMRKQKLCVIRGYHLVERGLLTHKRETLLPRR